MEKVNVKGLNRNIGIGFFEEESNTVKTGGQKDNRPPRMLTDSVGRLEIFLNQRKTASRRERVCVRRRMRNISSAKTFCGAARGGEGRP
ncbi:hypothetical protein J6590_055558 [Homalodisca vitripennis]|nr:hypothetical protein J6590_055558 [Homalodisca vitripennis]